MTPAGPASATHITTAFVSTREEPVSVNVRQRATRWGEVHNISPKIDDILAELVPYQDLIVSHQVYRRLDRVDVVRSFMQHHVFAVMDFMWLLKSLQRNLTCVDVPWVPVGRASTRRFINEIVLEEESDTYGNGYTSHFELYMLAMDETGADRTAIDTLVASVRQGEDPLAAVAACGAPAAGQRFIENTWSIISGGRLHEMAGAFAFGRENLIPDMFTSLVDLGNKVPGQVDLLLDYLERHIELDGEVHTPLAFEMLSELCGDDDQKWQDVLDAASRSLRARAALWDGVVETIERDNERG